MSKPSVAIIGSGFSALTLTNFLQEQATITLFEKARGVGGRMATRRAVVDDVTYAFDHGTQFFTARTKAFNAFLQPLIDDQVIQHWPARFAEITGDQITATRTWEADHPHYVGTPAMNAIGKVLAQRFNDQVQIQLNTRILQLHHEQGWYLTDQHDQQHGPYDWVITTNPAEQADQLFQQSQVSPVYRQHLQQVPMKACFSLMLGYAKPLNLDFDAALVRDKDISWISVNSSKPGRDEAYTLLVHSTNRWAQQHIDDERDSVIDYLYQQLQPIMPGAGEPVHQAVHGWHYANVDKQLGQDFHVDPQLKLASCGDWCIRGRVEAAFKSSFALSRYLRTDLKQKM